MNFHFVSSFPDILSMRSKICQLNPLEKGKTPPLSHTHTRQIGYPDCFTKLALRYEFKLFIAITLRFTLTWCGSAFFRVSCLSQIDQFKNTWNHATVSIIPIGIFDIIELQILTWSGSTCQGPLYGSNSCLKINIR